MCNANAPQNAVTFFQKGVNTFFTAKALSKVVVNNFVNPLHLLREPGTARNSF